MNRRLAFAFLGWILLPWPSLAGDAKGCAPKSAEAVCAAAGVGCGWLKAADGCGELGRVDCGPCGCQPNRSSGTFEVPAHAGYVHFEFQGPPAARLDVDVTIENDPGSDVGLYFAPFNGSIDGTQFYGGIQTNLARPQAGWVGKGFIFSRWATLDPADTRPAADGYIEVGTHEGEFVGVRLPFAWKPGDYRLSIARAEADGDYDWFEYTVTEKVSGKSFSAGALRFRRADPRRPATISLDGSQVAFVEIYSGTNRYQDVPAWRLQTLTLADGRQPVRVRSEYPAFPYAEFPNVDIGLGPSGDRVLIRYGGDTRRCHPPGLLFDASP